MPARFKKSSKVQWRWMGHVVEGSVEAVFFDSVRRKFRGTVFKRNGSREKPAYLVRSEAGSQVLKSETELEPRGKRG